MLFTLLTLTSSVSVFVGAITAASEAKAKLGGYVLAITIGSLLAVCNAWTMHKVVELLVGHPSRYSESRWSLHVFFFVVVCVWAPLWTILTMWITSTFLRLVA